jgi:hypothetical protein
MKNQRFHAATGRVAALVAAAFLGACATTNVAGNKTGWSDYATIATKDYDPVGIIRVTSEETRKRSVRIDRVDTTVHSTIPALEWLLGYTEKYSYTGTALAIKYTSAGPGAGSAPGPAPQGADQAPASGMGGGPG